MLQEIMYTGLGGAALLKERIDTELKKLEAKGKLSKEEAETFMTNLQERGKSEEAEIKARIKEALKEAADELGLATKADIEALKDALK